MEQRRFTRVGEPLNLSRLPASLARISIFSPLGRLWLYGIGMLVPMIYFARQYPVRQYGDKLWDIGNISRYERDAFWGYVLGMVVLCALYLLALRESGRVSARRALPVVFGCAVWLGVAMAWMYPVNATDVYIYAWRSRIFSEYGADPLAIPFRTFPDDPWMRFASREWNGRVSPYGPLWNLIALPITYLAGDNMLHAVIGFKMLAFLAHLLCGWIIARSLAATPWGNPVTGAIFFLWNPLVLWEGIGNGHNELVMLVPALLALLAWFRRRDNLVLPLLLLAALIKFVTLPLMPLAAIALWRRAGDWRTRLRLMVDTAALSAVAVLVAFFPFYNFGAMLQSMKQQSTLIRFSPASIIAGMLIDRYRVPYGTARQVVALLGISLLALAVSYGAGLLWRRPARLPRVSFEIVFVFFLVATVYWRPWYLITLVALAALLPYGRPAERTLLWCAGGLWCYAQFIWIGRWWKVDFRLLHDVGLLLMFGPVIALTIADMYRDRRRAQTVNLSLVPGVHPAERS